MGSEKHTYLTSIQYINDSLRIVIYALNVKIPCFPQSILALVRFLFHFPRRKRTYANSHWASLELNMDLGVRPYYLSQDVHSTDPKCGNDFSIVAFCLTGPRYIPDSLVRAPKKVLCL